MRAIQARVDLVGYVDKELVNALGEAARFIYRNAIEVEHVEVRQGDDRGPWDTSGEWGVYITYRKLTNADYCRRSD